MQAQYTIWNNCGCVVEIDLVWAIANNYNECVLHKDKKKSNICKQCKSGNNFLNIDWFLYT